MLRKLFLAAAAAAVLLLGAATAAVPAGASTVSHAQPAAPSCGGYHTITNDYTGWWLQDNGHTNKVTVSNGSCWYFVTVSSPWVEVVNVADGLCLEKGADPDNHTYMEGCNGSTSEQWKGAGTYPQYTLQNRHSGTFLYDESSGQGGYAAVGSINQLENLWAW